MNAVDMIEKRFQYISHGKKIKIEGYENPCYACWIHGDLGVLIPFNDSRKVYESFNNVVVKSIEIKDNQIYYLGLFCDREYYSRSFALICEDFLNESNGSRDELISNPMIWVKKWKTLLGNRSSDEVVYDLFAELITYKEVLKDDENAIWQYEKYPTHDIETSDYVVEVKSSTQKQDTIIHVNSKFQLQDVNKPVYLMFVRLEQANSGISIHELVDTFNFEQKNGIISSIEASGYNYNQHYFDERFNVLEMRKYLVDDKFPILKYSDINNELFMSSCISMNYCISLNSLPCEIINLKDKKGEND